MLPKIDGQFLFVLPLPLVSPTDPKASLFGIVYAYTDAAFNLIGKKELLICKGLAYKLPSPSYLFAQGINPDLIANGLSEVEFLTRLQKILQAPNLDIFTWSLHNLKIVDKMCSRNLEADLLGKVNSLIDVNKILKLDQYLNTGSVPNTDALYKCAKLLGFKESSKHTDLLFKLDALIYLVKHLNTNAQALLNFSLKGKQFKIDTIKNALLKGQTLLDFNTATHEINLLKPLVFDDSKQRLEALVYDNNGITRQFIYLSQFPLLSPATVLTPARQELTKISLNCVNKAFSETDIHSLKLDLNSLSIFEKFYAQLNADDKAYCKQWRSSPKNSLEPPALSCSKEFRQLVFLLRGNNFAGTLIDNELQYYYRMCQSLLMPQLKVYAKELKLLVNQVDENNQEQVMLLATIERYLSSL